MISSWPHLRPHKQESMARRAGEHGQESRRASPQAFLPEEQGLHAASCDQSWAPVVP